MTHDIPEAADETIETTEAAGESRADAAALSALAGAARPDGPPSAPSPVEADLDEALLGGPRALTVEGLAERAGLTERQVRSYWQALGLPITEQQEQMFTEDDAVALEEIYSVAEREKFDDRSLTTLIRSMGHTTERLVLWQVEALVEHMTKRFDLDDTSARLLVLDRLPDLAPVLETQLRHAWRRQLAAVAARFTVEFSEARAGDVTDSQALPLPRAVGFADIVSFTKRTAGLGSSELAEFVQLFETRARDIITAAGGRVVKTIGDAVLYVADDVATGAKVALGLAEEGERAGEGMEVPPVRVSLVWGRVLSRFGDVFGPSVNLASRLTEIAEPTTVLLDRETAALLSRDSRFALTAQPEREVQGLGVIEPVRLQWAYKG
ncbi:adenylate/guanylate cyclase domain-containing protein [Oerskovia sp. KBS0722]|uniref:adenylate/guanylate cyclase domain-containing protein n=1 Tax=Oerskovia sp. KBS0722 TaxID=1179673 RepID=UPI001FEEC840|nr:adenylate/guanylate cyclase domain-containing protein [Oerskovia sp. KBS0722]